MSDRKCLYVVLLADLEPGQMLAQTAHVVYDFSKIHADFEVGDVVVILEAPDEQRMTSLIWHADQAGVKWQPFYEPDLDNKLTAVAFAGGAQKYLADLPLALRKLRKKDPADLSAGFSVGLQVEPGVVSDEFRQKLQVLGVETK